MPIAPLNYSHIAVNQGYAEFEKYKIPPRRSRPRHLERSRRLQAGELRRRTVMSASELRLKGERAGFPRKSWTWPLQVHQIHFQLAGRCLRTIIIGSRHNNCNCLLVFPTRQREDTKLKIERCLSYSGRRPKICKMARKAGTEYFYMKTNE